MSKKKYMGLPPIEQEQIATDKFKRLMARSKTPKQIVKAFQYGIAVGVARAGQRQAKGRRG